MMDAARWPRVEAIFLEVADLPGPEREARMAALCGGDATLVADVRALLHGDASGSGGAHAPDPHVSLRLGNYVVGQPIARGGMAAVYEAHRADDAFEQRVAVKIMDLRLSDPALVAQFRAERQILATLEHPALTRLLDGGVTPSGAPYLVMEFVAGETIDQHCDDARLDLPARVRLFLQVCDAVAYAHRNLILHRDLKPSNILVSRDGQAKVVDFGTAALLQPDRESTISRAPLTPAYASPEQLTGQAVGTASDQYSLALVLYELLTGASAFPHSRSLMASVERAITGVPPTAPHTTVTPEAAAARQMSPARLRRQLAGDLGTILRKALAPDPRERYASVQHFADDLQRWMTGEPILGRAPSLAYRASRFVQRHWAATAIAALLALALLGASVVSMQLASRARAEAARARAESAKAQQLNRFLTEMLATASPINTAATAARSGSLTVRELLDTASRSVAGTLGGSPEIQAEMHHTLGRTYLGIGALDQAEAQFDAALTLFRRLGHTAGTASALAQQGRSRVLRGDHAAAAPFLREAVTLERSRGGDLDPDVLTDAMTNLALTVTAVRPADPEAIALLREAVGIADAHQLATANSVAMRQALGNQLLIGGALEESEAVLRDALGRAERIAPDHPTRLYVLRSLSELLRTRGDYDEAARFGQLAVDGAAKAWPPDYAFQPAFLLTWGRALAFTADLDRALAVIADAEARFRKLRPPTHPDFANVWLTQATVYRRRGDLARAERLLRQAETLLQAHPGIRHTRAHVLGELGLTLRAAGRATAAEALLAESHATYRDLLGDAHPLTALARTRIDGGAE